MDKQTADFYGQTAKETCERYEQVQSPFANLFKSLLPSPSVTLDIGAGSGRDMVLLKQLGHEVHGVEPSDEMRAQAFLHHPELKDRLIKAALPGLPSDWTGRFDLISCCAVLMHLPRDLLDQSARDMTRCIKPGGLLIVSTPKTRSGLDENHRDEQGRLFEPYSVEAILQLFQSLGLKTEEKEVSSDKLGRIGVSWNTVILSKPI